MPGIFHFNDWKRWAVCSTSPMTGAPDTGDVGLVADGSISFANSRYNCLAMPSGKRASPGLEQPIIRQGHALPMKAAGERLRLPVRPALTLRHGGKSPRVSFGSWDISPKQRRCGSLSLLQLALPRPGRTGTPLKPSAGTMTTGVCAPADGRGRSMTTCSLR